MGGGHVFFTDILTGTVDVAPVDSSSDGGVATALVSGQPYPFAVAVDAHNVYWSNTGNGTTDDVVQMPVGGGTHITLDAASGAGAWAIAVDSTSVYWTTDDGGEVLKAPIGGGTIVTIASSQANPQGIAPTRRTCTG